MKKIVVATQNPGKLTEFSRLLSPYGYTVTSMAEEAPSLTVAETGTSFGENARIKAQAVHEATGLAVLADDSGLCVDALGGAPGIYSARYGGAACRSDADRRAYLLKEMENIPPGQRAARFVAHLCYLDEQGNAVIFEESCQGEIGREERGRGGFGYDALFLVEDGRSFGELSAEEKDAVSHRGKALRRMLSYFAQKEGKESC